MARRRTLDRHALREQSDAAEAQEKTEDEVLDEEEEEEEDEEEEADDAEGEAEGGDDSEEGGGDEDDEDAPKKKAKKKKPEPKVKKAPAKRTRAVKEVRMKAVWVVFDNGGKRVKEFPYPQKAAAETLLAEKLGDEKKGTFYIQLVKEPLEA